MAMTRGRRLFGRFNLILSALLAVALWGVVTALATRPAFKALIDVTPQQRFSVSGETEDLLRDLARRDAVLRIDTFYSRMPAPRTPEQGAMIAIQDRIQTLTRDLLVRYAELGGQNVEIHDYDDRVDIGPARSRIEELGGLRGENVIVVSIGKRKRELSLALDLAEIDLPGGNQRPVPGAQRTMPTLKLYKGEEAISTAVRSLLVEGTPKVYFLVGFEGQAELAAAVADSYSELLNALGADGFEIDVLNLEAEGSIPDDATILAVVDPRGELSEAASDLLIDWIRQGGRLFLNTSWSPVTGGRWNPTFDFLGESLGFEIGSELVCELVPDPRMPNSAGVGGEQATNLVIKDRAAHPITRPLTQNQRYPQLKIAREVRPRTIEGSTGLRVEPLLRTGAMSWLAPRQPGTGEVVLDPPSRREAYGPRTVAMVVEVDRDDGRPGEVVLLGGVAFVNGGGLEYNGDLALNIFNWMAQRTELVTVRGNTYRSRRMQLAPQQVASAQNLLWWWVPGTLLLIGVLVIGLRSRRG